MKILNTIAIGVTVSILSSCELGGTIVIDDNYFREEEIELLNSYDMEKVNQDNFPNTTKDFDKWGYEYYKHLSQCEGAVCRAEIFFRKCDIDTYDHTEEYRLFNMKCSSKEVIEIDGSQYIGENDWTEQVKFKDNAVTIIVND